ncbi:hypothetical protein CBP51_19815 [Cellvibrio mixtus]|uniref:Immunity protein 52 domain-containing protein n=1 Tax=Cellvibrio mixtus TaxID=39650 RepID=A0A266Q2Q9_9GAMM|nr:hypothetical protein [Cellvibrio mixtus]OZY83649.1 hypothetical protein CBP51_19815 [Cellvibrio mixtus]
MKDTIKIVTRFKTKNLTAREYIALSKAILQSLKAFHKAFEIIHSWGDKPTSWTMIDDDFSNFNNTVLNHIFDEEIIYTDAAGNKVSFSPEAMSWARFSNSYSNIKNPHETKYLISIGAGGESGWGFVNIELPPIYFDEFRTTKKLIDLIDIILQKIELEGAYVYTKTLYDHVVDYDKDYDIEIGWLNYFKNKNIQLHIPTELFHSSHKNGIVFWLENEISTPTKETINLAMEIRNILGDLGYLNLEQ